MLVFKFQVWKNVKSLMKKKFNIHSRLADKVDSRQTVTVGAV